VYFYPGSRGRSAFVLRLAYLFLPLFPSVIGRLSPNALNFKFRATTVSTVAATTDFRVFPPAYALSFVSVAHPLSGPVIRNRHRDLRRGISGYPHTFIYGATLYVSELILWFILRPIAGPLPACTERRVSRLRFESPSLRALRVT